MNATFGRTGLVSLSTLWLTLVAGCFGTPSSFMKQSDQGNAALITMKKTTDAGITSGTLDPDAFYPQVLSATDAGELAGSSATFPPGSLAISTEITIQEGASIATAALAGSLSISSGFEAAAAPVAVTAAQNIDAARPFTIAIPVPSSTTSLFSLSDPYERLVVAYIIKVAETGETRMGVLPRSALIINGNQVAFETSHFGIFQAALTVEKVLEERKAETVASAIQMKATQAELPAMAITGRSQLVVKEGESVTLTGKNFRPTIRLALNGKSIASLKLASDASLSFVAPADTNLGLVSLTADQEGQTQSVSLIFDGKGTYPVISDDKSKVCNDVTYYDLTGVLQTGTRVCNAVAAPATADCVADGEVGCKTTAAFKAANMANFTTATIPTGITIAGVIGTGTGESHSMCVADGAVGCVTSASYPAADAAMASAGNIKSGITIAGVVGTLIASPVNCSTDGQTGCVVVGPSFKAIDMSGVVAGNIKNGVTLAGTMGTYPSVSAPLSGATASTDLTSLTASTPAGAYEFFDSAGTRYTGSIMDAGTITPSASNQTLSAGVYRQFTVNGDPDLVPANILSGTDIFGVVGTLPASASNCTGDAQVGCITTVTYKSADLTNVTPGNIKSGITIAGISGQYPSVSYPLPGASGTADLDAATFNAKIRNSSPFEYWNAEGALQTGAGENNLSAGSYPDTVTMFGVTGGIPTCSTDGESSCLTTAIYRAANTLNFDSWDIRKGKIIAGINGELAFNRNMISSAFNRSTGIGAIAGSDLYDTVEDGATPSATTSVPGWPAFTTANWAIDPNQDGVGGTLNGLCDGSEVCILKDMTTFTYWYKDSNTTYTWENAITYCENLTIGSYTDWRLPTQKEWMQAYVDGIWHQSAPLAMVSTPAYWTATTMSSVNTNAFAFSPQNGALSATTKSAANRALCVRTVP